MATQLYRTLTGSSQKSQNSKHDGQAGGLAAPTDLSKITTTNTQTGVLNHLTPEQDKLLDQFKERLLADGWWSPDGINGKPTHDDGTLLRYLRARKFDVQGAIGQFTDTEQWLKEQNVEDLYENFDVEFYERARVMYPQWTGHRDRRGIPIYVYEIKGLDSKSVEKYQKESAAYKAKLPKHKDLSTPPKMLPLFALYHNLLNFVLPLCSSLERPHPEVPITNSTNIVDISGVSLRQFWNLKNHMQDASVLATAHYPETLDRIFIIGAPSFFPTVWGWIKRWFDPVTVSKIFILGKPEVKPTLEKFMDPSCFPIKYGGKLDWAWGDLPAIDEETRAALEKDGLKGWVRGPALWLNNERIVVGSDNGKLRRSPKEIAEKKPIVYAADYTEDPVHPEKRRSSVSSFNVKTAQMNGSTNVQPPTTLPEVDTPRPEENENKQLGLPTVAVTAPISESEPTAIPEQDTPKLSPKLQKQQIPSNIPLETVRNSPMGDSQVSLPKKQAASPATTAEYISPTPSREEAAAPSPAPLPAPATFAPAPETPPAPAPAETQSKVTDESLSHSAGSTAAATAATSTVPTPPTTQFEAASPPAGHTAPGPLPAHTTQINRAIAKKLEQESTVTIPAEANGTLSHPEIIVASDTSKGLAMETDKLALAGGKDSPARPQPERFVTAMEIPH